MSLDICINFSIWGYTYTIMLTNPYILVSHFLIFSLSEVSLRFFASLQLHQEYIVVIKSKTKASANDTEENDNRDSSAESRKI